MTGLKPKWSELINLLDMKGFADPSYILYKLREIYEVLEDVYSVEGEEELQSAIDQIGTGAGTIFIEAGTHELTKPLTVDGGGSYIIQGHGDGSVLKANGNWDMIDITNATYCMVRNLKLDRTGMITASIQAIDINEASDNKVIIENVTIINSNVQAIKIRSNNVIVRECHIDDGSNGITLDASTTPINNVKILNNRIENTNNSLGYASIYLNQDCTEIEIAGNRILEGATGIYGAGSQQLRCHISNNYIYSCSQFGINIEQIHDGVINNNIVDTCAHGICLSFTSSYNNIIGNVLADNIGNGIWLSHVNVSYTTLLNNSGGAIVDNGTNTIRYGGGYTGWFDDGVNFRATVEDGLIIGLGNSIAGGHDP